MMQDFKHVGLMVQIMENVDKRSRDMYKLVGTGGATSQTSLCDKRVSARRGYKYIGRMMLRLELPRLKRR